MPSPQPLRIGSISYINSLPVDLALTNGQVSLPDAQVFSAYPSILNEKILAGQIDLGPVSAFWYAQHAKEFFVLPNLSISSESGVESVLLFSRRPLNELEGKTIGLTGEGRTTPVLLQILLKKFYGVTAKTVTYTEKIQDFPSHLDALLLIGDTALVCQSAWKDEKLYVFDLAKEWKDKTGFPFVFAVWAVRCDFFKSQPRLAERGYSAILESKRWGMAHPAEVLKKAVEITHLPEAELRAYFSCLSYDFDANLQNGLRFFLKQASDFGFLLVEPVVEFMPASEFAPAVGTR